MLPSTQLIPIHDDNPTRSLPLVTILLIVANVLVFLTEPNLGMGSPCDPALAKFLYRWGVVPREVLSGNEFDVLRCSIGPGAPTVAIPLADKNVYLALLTSMFVHGGLAHIFGNMLFLWVFGNNIEDNIGKIRFTIFYLMTGLLAGAAHIIGNPNSPQPTVGASGAIAGILGAYILLYPRARVTTIVPIFGFFSLFFRPVVPASVVLGVWFVSQFFIAVGQRPTGGGVAWLAHVGGFVAGLLLIKLFGGKRRPPRPEFVYY